MSTSTRQTSNHFRNQNHYYNRNQKPNCIAEEIFNSNTSDNTRDESEIAHSSNQNYEYYSDEVDENYSENGNSQLVHEIDEMT